jgi:GAF domain-containing protein
MTPRGGKSTKARRRTRSAKARRSAGGKALGDARVALLKRELAEVQEQQTATSEVLRIISASPGELQPVFDAMLANATRICGAEFGLLYRSEGDEFRTVALYGAPPEFAEQRRRNPMLRPSPGTALGRVVSTKQMIQIPDVQAEPAYQNDPLRRASFLELARARTVVCVPMLKDSEVVGAISIYRQEVRPFTDKQIALLTNFAAQAVIAIENARLLNELRQRTDDLTEALEQQTATSDVLKVISHSPGDLEPVFNAMLENAVRICGAKYGMLALSEGEQFRTVAMHGVEPALVAKLQGGLRRPGPNTAAGRVARTKQPVHIADVQTEPGFFQTPPGFTGPQLAIHGGARTLLAVPMLKESQLVGYIAIYRQEVQPFTDKQIALVTNFAAQAVIAIENTRLLNELRESLQQQTATSEVLSVISSSPGELEPVFQAMLENALRICDAKFGHLVLYDGERFHAAALRDVPPAYAAIWQRGPIEAGPKTGLARILATKQAVHVLDLKAEEAYAEGDPLRVASVDHAGARTFLCVPMLKDNGLVGAIAIYRQEVRPFTDKQIELVSNFAKQAVIAIENTRLLNELRESLAQQTATADVLKTISRSTFDLKAVLDTLVESAARLCEADMASINRARGDAFQQVACYGYSPEFIAFMENHPIPAGRGSIVGRTVLEGGIIHVADVLADPDFKMTGAARLGGIRTMLGVPLMREGTPIGVVNLQRKTVRPFTEQQIALVTTFADQAVIAIENVRLFDEVQARTRELQESLEYQTAISDVLGVISRSPSQIQPVIETIAETAQRLCQSTDAYIFRLAGEHYHLDAVRDAMPEQIEFLRKFPLARNRESITGRVALEGRTVHVTDVLADPDYMLHARGHVGYRTILGVPLLRNQEVIGVIVLTHQVVRPFTERQIELVTTFADQAVIAIENARLFDEVQARTRDLTEALEQQTATADVLKVISSSPGELEPVFQAMLENATRICEAKFGVMFRYEDGRFRVVAMLDLPEPLADHLLRDGGFVRSLEPGQVLERVWRTKQVAHTADGAALPNPSPAATIGGARSTVAVPMLKDNELIGAFVIYRQEVRPFTDKQIELVQNFAAQAVIAIENTRLLNELRESLQQQTATAEVLKVISRSTFDLETVLNTLLESATRLCEGQIAWVFQRDSEVLRWAASYGHTPEVHARIRDYFKPLEVPIDRGSVVGRAASEAAVVHITDVLADPEYRWQGAQKIGGYRACLGAPLLREGNVVGVLFVAKTVTQPFTAKQIELVKTFADQAVIAIENTRLLNELRQRTDDLTEALEQQTATSEVLKVISSSPANLEPVFQSMLNNALRICDAKFGAMFRFDGDESYPVAEMNSPLALKEWLMQRGRRRSPAGQSLHQVLETKQVYHVIDDLTSDNPSPPARLAGARTHLAVPMLKDDELVGAIVIYRQEVRPFSDKQIELVKNFAAQAVIAIENTRLLNELRQRTDDLTEALEQQTATSNVLEIISRSAFDLQPVFDTVVESAVRVCGADKAIVFRFDGELLRLAATFNASPELREWIAQNPIRPGRHSGAARAALERRTIHVHDIQADPDYTYGAKHLEEAIRTILGVPILKGDDLLGVIIIYRLEVNPFTEKQIALVETFADQAAIAIENVRLFDALQQRTKDLTESLQQQTATADVLKVISRSAFDLRTVLDTLLRSALRLCDADMGTIAQRKGNVFYRTVSYGFPAAFMDYVKDLPVEPGRATGTGRALSEGKVIHIPDVQSDPDYTWKEAQRLGGFRTMLGVPMMREGEPIGVMALTRTEVRPFTDKQIELVSTFADQAAIAIENVRLFDEIQDKSRQLAEASQHKSQFLANMSHELRTPLNAILGYTELILDGIYGETPDKMRATLERIQRNGRHLLGLINDVLDLSKIEAGQLNLALADYSMKDVVHNVYSAVESLASGKNLALKLDLSPNLPPGRGDERKLTQVLLNLVGNAIKFTDAGEVAIKASAANGAFTVAVRDSGPGIAEADQAKIFEEFQQADSSITRKKGGTGLGLAIAKRIIEMHGGRIWVESSPGRGSTFSFSLPARVEQQVGQP